MLFQNIASKGISSYLLKPSAKRRRTKEQIRQEKIRAQALQLEVNRKVSEFDAMFKKVEVAEAQAKEASKIKDQLQGLLSQGAIMVDANGLHQCC